MPKSKAPMIKPTHPTTIQTSSSRGESNLVRDFLGKAIAVTTIRPTQKNGCVNGLINECFAIYVNPRVRPHKHYLVHVRGIGTNNETWSAAHAKVLGGVYKSKSKGHDACVAIAADSLEQVGEIIDALARITI